MALKAVFLCPRRSCVASSLSPAASFTINCALLLLMLLLLLPFEEGRQTREAVCRTDRSRRGCCSILDIYMASCALLSQLPRQRQAQPAALLQ